MPIHQKVKKFIEPTPSPRSYTVVFDIDECLCCRGEDSVKDLKRMKKQLPECPIIHFTHDSCGKIHYIFLPYLQILFDYLLEQGARIVFFSGGSEERNVAVIPALLTSFWGDQKYKTLKSKGQFDIFSKEDLHNHCREDHKDLNVVIRDGESLSDVVLVDNDPFFTVRDQKPSIHVRNIWCPFWADADIDRFHERTDSVYYMIGLFKTYFERKKYRKLPLREGLQCIIPEDHERTLPVASPFVRKMMELGLSEVRKQIPNATFYRKQILNATFYRYSAL
jgi:hypothetical protein